MQYLKAFKGKYFNHPDFGTPSYIREIALDTSGINLEKLPDHLLSLLQEEIDFSGAFGTIHFDKIVEIPFGQLILLQQKIGDWLISDAWLKIYTDHSGQVLLIYNDLIPDMITRNFVFEEIGKGCKENEAIQIVANELSIPVSGIEVKELEQVCLFHERKIRVAWKIVINSEDPYLSMQAYVNSDTGNILRKYDLLWYGQGNVFNPNPIASLDNVNLTYEDEIGPLAYEKVILKNLENNGYLDGKYVNTTITPDRVSDPDHKFEFERYHPGFREVMAYYHIDSYQEYLQSLGFLNLVGYSIPVDVKNRRGPTFDPSRKLLKFNDHAVPGAEDAEVIVHEYAHAVQDSIVPGFGKSTELETKALGEGFADYLAASYFYDLKSEPLTSLFALWVGTGGRNPTIPPFLRRLDTPYTLEDNFGANYHKQGQVWSACLWKIRQSLGQAKADYLAISHCYQLKRNITFREAGIALIDTDKMLNGGANFKLIHEILIEKKIIKSDDLSE